MDIYEDLGFRKVVFLRFNPDMYSIENDTFISPFSYTKTGIVNVNKKEMKRRIGQLVEKMNFYRNNTSEKEIVVEYLFYGKIEYTPNENFHIIS